LGREPGRSQPLRRARAPLRTNHPGSSGVRLGLRAKASEAYYPGRRVWVRRAREDGTSQGVRIVAREQGSEGRTPRALGDERGSQGFRGQGNGVEGVAKPRACRPRVGRVKPARRGAERRRDKWGSWIRKCRRGEDLTRGTPRGRPGYRVPVAGWRDGGGRLRGGSEPHARDRWVCGNIGPARPDAEGPETGQRVTAWGKDGNHDHPTQSGRKTREWKLTTREDRADRRRLVRSFDPR